MSDDDGWEAAGWLFAVILWIAIVIGAWIFHPLVGAVVGAGLSLWLLVSVESW